MTNEPNLRLFGTENEGRDQNKANVPTGKSRHGGGETTEMDVYRLKERGLGHADRM